MRVFTNILLIIILVIVTPVLLLVTSAKTNVLHTTFLKHELEQQDIYTVAFSIVDEQVKEMELAPEIPITHEELSSLITNVLTPAWLQGNVESILDDFDTWLNAPEGTEISIVLNMAEPKVNLAAELDVLFEKKLAELVACTPEDENMFCMFAGLGLDDFKAELANFDFDPQDMINTIPDELDINNLDFIDSFGKDEEGSDENKEGSIEGMDEQQLEEDEKDLATQIAEIKEELEQYKQYYNLGLESFWYAWILYGVLVALFIIMNSTGGWRRLVHWIGVLFLVVGILPLVMGAGMTIVVDNAILPSISFTSNAPDEVVDVVPKLIDDVRQLLFTVPLVVGIVLVALGLAGTIGAHWIPKSKHTGKEKEEKK